MNGQRSVELLAPAGNFEKLKMALHYGADAVYAGLSEFSLRAQTGQFTADDLKQWINYVHDQKKKIFVTMNIFAHNRDLEMVREHAKILRELKPDGVVVADPGVFEVIAEESPGVPIHISTQANVTNKYAARFWERQGARRIVLARELTVDELKEMRDAVSLELEAFVHGAMCIAYSGRCFLSSFMNNRNGNKGECANNCRYNYTLMEEKRPGEYFPVYEDDRGTYIMSSRDLCMIEHLRLLRDAGADSFKLEGRMKGINYAAGVVKAYRDAIDLMDQEEEFARRLPGWMNEFVMISNRGYTTGMYFGKQPDDGFNHDTPTYMKPDRELAAVINEILEDGRIVVGLRNSVHVGDQLSFLTPGLEEDLFELGEMWSESGEPISTGRNNETVIIHAPHGIRLMDVVRRMILPKKLPLASV